MHRTWSTLALATLTALALLTLTLPAGGQAPPNNFPPPAANAPVTPQFNRPQQPNVPPQTTPVPPAGNPAASSMDIPLKLINDAAASFAGVRDYSCLFIKQEQIKGQLQPENVIAMRVRNQPFSVYLRWLGPKTSAGQEVCYVAGKNNNQMRVHSPGILGMAGFVSIDQRDPRALATSRHQISDAGVGKLIERFQREWEKERQLNRTQVRVGEYEYNKRPCTRVETIHPENNPTHFPSYRTVIYFDKETRLPIRLESYDWPAPGSPRDGALQEMYSYVDLRFNIGLTDDQFKY